MAINPAPRKLPPKRVLVADDESLVAFTIRRVLLLEGHTVELAEDGEKALNLFEAGSYDLVITDFRLPGMDGLELAEAIKQRVPETRVILITAYAERIQPGMGKISNVDLVLGKPFSVEQLHEALETVFRAP
jgi:CheY-like chemotaxis protein